jgi:hypothetical protein
MVLLFEQYVEGNRVKLFNEGGLDDDGIWNYVVGGNVERLGKN